MRYRRRSNVRSETRQRLAAPTSFKEQDRLVEGVADDIAETELGSNEAPIVAQPDRQRLAFEMCYCR